MRRKIPPHKINDFKEHGYEDISETVGKPSSLKMFSGLRQNRQNLTFLWIDVRIEESFGYLEFDYTEEINNILSSQDIEELLTDRRNYFLSWLLTFLPSYHHTGGNHPPEINCLSTQYGYVDNKEIASGVKGALYISLEREPGGTEIKLADDAIVYLTIDSIPDMIGFKPYRVKYSTAGYRGENFSFMDYGKTFIALEDKSIQAEANVLMHVSHDKYDFLSAEEFSKSVLESVRFIGKTETINSH